MRLCPIWTRRGRVQILAAAPAWQHIRPIDIGVLLSVGIVKVKALKRPRVGILSAARSLGLDFIPVGEEEYDFALLRSTLELKEMKEFLEILTGDAFRESVERIGGYDCTDSGRVIFVN